MPVRALELRSFLSALAFASLAMGLLAPRLAWATKKVSLEWKAIKGAAKYELQIQKGEEIIDTQILDDTEWSGELDFGHYSYRIRAIDKVKRPGVWTAPLNLVVMPKAPDPVSPKDDASVAVYGATAPIRLEWSKVKGATKYKVVVKEGSEVVHRASVAELAHEIKTLKPGKYTWTVSTVIEAGRGPASISDKNWNSDPSESFEFEIERKKLEAPSLIAPVGTLSPPSSKRLMLQWKPVEGATGYEVTIKRAGSRATPRVWRPTKPSLMVAVSTEGDYHWTVRAVNGVPQSAKPDAVSETTAADFKLDADSLFVDGSGYLAISGMLAPYNYRVVAPGDNFEGTTAATSSTLRLSGEYWFSTHWGMAAAWETTSMTLNSEKFSRGAYELLAKYRLSLSQDRYGWFLALKGGLEARDYLHLTPSDEINPTGSALESVSVNAKGVTVGFDVRKQFSEKWSLGAKFSYFRPMTIGGAPSGEEITLTGDASYRNISFGIQALYWLGGRWGLGMGAFIENRSISANGPNESGKPADEIYMDGKYFFGSLIYSFGK